LGVLLSDPQANQSAPPSHNQQPPAPSRVPDELAAALDRQADELIKQLPPDKPALLDGIKPKVQDAITVSRCELPSLGDDGHYLCTLASIRVRMRS
jgi:hypothetical protein